MVHYGLNQIKLAFATQYKTVILNLLTYLGLLIGLGLENAGLEPEIKSSRTIFNHDGNLRTKNRGFVLVLENHLPGFGFGLENY